MFVRATRVLSLCLFLLIVTGCGTKSSSKTQQYSGVVGTCKITKQSPLLDLCLGYTYSAEAESDPKEASVNQLKTSCTSVSGAVWQTDGTCDIQNAKWICDASSVNDSATATLKMTISGDDATQANAKLLCDTYKGTLSQGKSN